MAETRRVSNARDGHAPTTNQVAIICAHNPANIKQQNMYNKTI